MLGKACPAKAQVLNFVHFLSVRFEALLGCIGYLGSISRFVQVMHFLGCHVQIIKASEAGSQCIWSSNASR